MVSLRFVLSAAKRKLLQIPLKATQQRLPLLRRFRRLSTLTDHGLLTDEVPLAVVCGPSGVGKGTLISHLRNQFKNVELSVSHTTRAPRRGEVEGEHYTFLSKQAFENGVTGDEYIEHSEVHGQYYGTSQTHLEKMAHCAATGRRQICLLEIDVIGAHKIGDYVRYDLGHNIKARFLFVTCHGSLSTLESRLIGRGTETQPQIDERLNTAAVELAFLEKHSHFFDAVISNDDLEVSKRDIVSVFGHWFPWLKPRRRTPTDECAMDF